MRNAKSGINSSFFSRNKKKFNPAVFYYPPEMPATIRFFKFELN